MDAESTPPESSDDVNVRAALAALGIVGAASRLDTLGYSTEACMRQARSSLDFWGNSAAKWLDDTEVFEHFLRRMQEGGGKVRLLLLDPEGETFHRLSANPTSLASHSQLAALRERFSCLQLKYYDSIPLFRIVNIDNERMLVARYLFKSDAPKSQRGWELPQALINRGSPWSFHDTFVGLFEECWNRGRAPRATSKPAIVSGSLGRRVVISYARLDDRYRLQLMRHLKGFPEHDIWHDGLIGPGADWNAAIAEALESCGQAVLLVTPDYLASHFIRETELPALIHAEGGRFKTLWIHWVASNVERQCPEIYSRQALHDVSRPIRGLSADKRDQALAEIAGKIARSAGWLSTGG